MVNDISDIIRDKLHQSLNIQHLEIINDSALHHGHSGDNGSGNSHFTINISATEFSDISLVARHRLIYDALDDLMNNPIHALAINIQKSK